AWDGHDVAGRERHVLRVGAVARHAYVAGRGRTQGLAPAPAEVTDAARQIEMTRDPIADLDLSDLGAELDDLARDLVSGNARKRRHAAGDPGHDHDGEPDTGRAHAQQDVVGPDLGHGDGRESERGSERWKDHRLHRLSLCHTVPWRGHSARMSR